MIRFNAFFLLYFFFFLVFSSDALEDKADEVIEEARVETWYASFIFLSQKKRGNEKEKKLKRNQSMMQSVASQLVERGTRRPDKRTRQQINFQSAKGRAQIFVFLIREKAKAVIKGNWEW